MPLSQFPWFQVVIISGSILAWMATPSCLGTSAAVRDIAADWHASTSADICSIHARTLSGKFPSSKLPSVEYPRMASVLSLPDTMTKPPFASTLNTYRLRSTERSAPRASCGCSNFLPGINRCASCSACCSEIFPAVIAMLKSRHGISSKYLFVIMLSFCYCQISSPMALHT